MTVAALVVSVVALLISFTNAYYIRKNARVAEDASARAGHWREDDRLREEPQFSVEVIPHWVSHSLADVEVVVQNTSVREATINHIGLTDTLRYVQHDMNGDINRYDFPLALSARHQLDFIIPGDQIIAQLGEEDGPDKLDFIVYVANDTIYGDGLPGSRWNSKPFTVTRPPADPICE